MKAIPNSLKNSVRRFEQELRKDKRKWGQESGYASPALKKLDVERKAAEKCADFYRDIAGDSAETNLRYQTALKKLAYLPAMVKEEEALTKALAEKREQVAGAKNRDRSAYENAFQSYQSKRMEQRDRHIDGLKSRYKAKTISQKALRDGVKAEKLKMKEDFAIKKLEDPYHKARQEYRSLRHKKRSHLPQKKRVLEADIADLRRKLPYESRRKKPLCFLLNLIFPGLGQLANGQIQKSFFFFLGGLFVWLFAVPYALGFGNYQGNGIAGLITLAEGGRRLDRSLIFMIEGIVALALLLIAVCLYYFALRDAYSVEKKSTQGIRPNNWFETKQVLSEKGFPYIVSSPAFIVILFIVLVPVFTTILLSFTNMDPKNQSKFVWAGLNNFKTIALGQGVAGKVFWHILGWTILWTLFSSSLAIFIGFVLALLVNQDRIRGKRIWRTIYLLPWAVPAFITIMFFSIMLAPNGLISNMLSSLSGQIVNVKNDTTLTRIALILLQGWLGSSYIFLLCTGILQSIPKDLYEAAEIDGASSWQRLRHITVPLLLYQIAPLLVGQYTFNFNNYSIIALFNDGGPFAPSKYGNLAGSSDILISYIFKLTIQNQYQALGAAITILISFALMFFSYLGYRRTKAFQE